MVDRQPFRIAWRGRRLPPVCVSGARCGRGVVSVRVRWWCVACALVPRPAVPPAGLVCGSAARPAIIPEDGRVAGALTYFGSPRYFSAQLGRLSLVLVSLSLSLSCAANAPLPLRGFVPG